MWIFKTAVLALFTILHVQALKDVEDTSADDKSRISKRITLKIFAILYTYNIIFIFSAAYFPSRQVSK